MERSPSLEILCLAPDSMFVSFLCPFFIYCLSYISLLLPFLSLIAFKGSSKDVLFALIKPGGFFKQKLIHTGFMPNTCVTLSHVPFIHHYMHRYDLSFGQAGLPGSCAYPYVPDCYCRVSRTCTSDWVKPKASVLKGIFGR